MKVKEYDKEEWKIQRRVRAKLNPRTGGDVAREGEKGSSKQ